MNIPDKAMDAAFQAATGGAELHLDDRMYWEQSAKDMLEAAAPFIAAQALRDAAEDLAQKLHEPGCNWGTRANDAGHLLALADLQEATP